MVHPKIPLLHNALPLAAAILLVGIMGLTVLFGYEYDQENDALRNSLNVQTSLAQLFSTVRDAEAANRGFLLTGDEDYLTYIRRR